MNAAALASLVEMTNHLASINAAYLTISVAVLALAGGATYYFNVKPFKEKVDKQEDKLLGLQKDVELSISASRIEISEQQEKMEQKISGLQKEVEQKLSASRVEIGEQQKKFEDEIVKKTNQVIDQKGEKINADTKTEIAIFARDFSKQFDDQASRKDDELKELLLNAIGKSIADSEKMITQKMESSFVKIYNKIKELELQLMDVQAFKYHSEGKKGGIYLLIELLEAEEKEDHVNLQYTLKRIRKLIPNYTMIQKYADRLRIVLAKIKEKYPEHGTVVGEIEKLIEIDTNNS